MTAPPRIVSHYEPIRALRTLCQELQHDQENDYAKWDEQLILFDERDTSTWFTDAIKQKQREGCKRSTVKLQLVQNKS